ncbi:MAG: hypothetical protein AB8U25_00065 [Rickettsiales endosymbiont of Dermacentor nuttalli]
MFRAVSLLLVSTSLISCSGDFQQFKQSFGKLIVFTKSHTAQSERRIPEGNKKYLAQIKVSASPVVTNVKEVQSKTAKNTVVPVKKDNNKQSVGTKFKNLFKRSKPVQDNKIVINKEAQKLNLAPPSNAKIEVSRPIKCLPSSPYMSSLSKEKKHNKTKIKTKDEFPDVHSIPPKPVVIKDQKGMQTKISNDINSIKQAVQDKFSSKNVKSKTSVDSKINTQNTKENSKPVILPMPSQSIKPAPVVQPIPTVPVIPIAPVPTSSNNIPAQNKTVPQNTNIIDQKNSDQKSKIVPMLLLPPLSSNITDSIKNSKNAIPDDHFLPTSRYRSSSSK